MSDVASESLEASLSEFERRVHNKIRRELGELICGLLEQRDVEEIMLNDDGNLWVHRAGCGNELAGQLSAVRAESVIGSVATTLKTQVTMDNPILECELPIDGSRFEALIPPVVSSPTFTIRKKATKIYTLDDYVSSGIISIRQVEIIKDAVLNKKNILIVGGTGSGKTTLTNAVIHEMSKACPNDRIVIIEDTLELQCSSKNKVQLRAVEHVDMTRLLKATMRLRPDRILVGEVRDGAALALLKAWNTGHPGGVATAHANNSMAGLIRIEQLISEVTQSPMRELISEAIDLVIAINVEAGGERKVKEIIEVSGFDGVNYIVKNI